MMSLLNEQLECHLARHAAAFDSDAVPADGVLPLLGAHGLPKSGVPERLGNSGGARAKLRSWRS